MDRAPNHFTDSSARCPLRPKEMKLDFGGVLNDDRLPQMTMKPDERRGFRPAPRLQALHPSRGKHRGTAMADASGGNHVNVSGSVGEGLSAMLSPNLLPTDTPKETQLHVGGHLQPVVRRRSLEFALTASPQMRLKAKTHAAGRHLRVSDTMPTSHARSLWVEGNSVLNTEASAASSALACLSECVARERQIKEEWEAARFAKLQAFRAVVKVFMMSFTDLGGRGGGGGSSDPRQTNVKGITDTLAAARCSVVTNGLVGTIQSFARAFRSRQVAAARGTLPAPASSFRPATSSVDFALSLYSGVPSTGVSGEDAVSASQSYSTSDALDQEEVSRLRQLYFDYFDCEPVSISTVAPSGNESSVFDMASAVPPSRPSTSSSSLTEDVDRFARCASSKT